MIDFYSELLSHIHFNLFLLSMLLFFIGYALAPTIYFKKIRLLTAYPLWIAGKMEIWAQKKWNPILLFLFLFILNATSLLVNFFSGYLPLLPLLFAIWTGINIGLITYHSLNGEYYFASMINPVALFELPAAFLSFTVAIQFGLMRFTPNLYKIESIAFSQYMQLFYYLVIPLLVLSGIVETFLILFSQKMEDYHDPNE